MDKAEFKKQIVKIQTAYNKKFTQEELRLWFKEFQNMSSDNFENAVDRTIKELKFVPKIADIKARLENSLHKNHTKKEFRSLYKNLEWCEMYLDEY